MGLYKSSIRITRGKSSAKEVASIAKESACALPLLEHVGDLRAIFEILRKYKLCLNAYKCSFGVGSGKFLGYIVTHRGIEVNPDQIKAGPSWMDSIIQFLKEDILPEERIAADKVRRKAIRY